MVSGEPDSWDASLCSSPEPGGQSRRVWLNIPGSSGGPGRAGELQAVLKEMEKTCAGGWPECKYLMGWEGHFECV